ncbi:MAG: GAF domain-containing protein, partial [Dehalococcoidia bacterium]|nr:GAF domain-containing protein [Dehalococcoidia bacterium]
MSQPDERDRRIQELEERLARLSEASLRINESLDFDRVLQEVVDSARALTASRYGAITVRRETGRLSDLIVSGLSSEEHQGLLDMPQGPAFFEYLSGLGEPLRVSDVDSHMSALNMPIFLPPVRATSLLVAPIRHQGVGVGTIYLAHDHDDRQYTREDEETLVMFASQAAMVIANARRHQKEQRTRADLETLVDTSPVGVVVLDAVTGSAKSFNREARRIVDSLRNPDQTPEDLLDVMTFQRADGREVSLREFPMAELLSTGETVRAEEIAFGVPDGRRVTVLLNATPIRSDEGAIESVVVTLQDMADVEELERLRAEFLAMVSHELRGPLTSIKGSAATVLDSSAELDPAVVRQFFRIIGDQADHMHDLVSDLLDVARIETGELAVSPEPAEITVMVDRARSAFLGAGGTNRLSIDIAPDLPLVAADRRRIVQVLGNLLSNAARHSPESSVIRVTAVRDGVHVAVSVVNEGQGIPAESLP